MTRQTRHALAAALLLAATAFVPPVHAQTSEEAMCRKTMSRSLAKFVSTVFKDIATCHRKRGAGKLPLSVNCNDVFSIPGGKSVAAYDKASLAMLDDCPDTLATVLAQFARCPSPHSTLDDDGATAGIDSFDEATDCVLNLAATLGNGAARAALGHPAAVPDPAVGACQAAIAKQLRKRINTIGKVRRGCQGDADRDESGVAYSCATYDDGSIADNLADFVAAISSKCAVPQDELTALDACGQTPEQIIECAGGISTVLGGGLAAAGYELPSQCSIGLALLHGNAGLGRKRTDTRFELGTSGLGQGTDLLDDFLLATNISCNDDCVDCAVTLNPLKPLPQSFCRCANDSSIHCDTIAGADADDCGGGDCVCMFAPPLPLSTAGVPVCVINEFESDIEGDLDVGTGVSTTTIHNAGHVFLGVSELRPCPTCDGDASSNDGLRGGTCNGGARDGQTCDQNADSPDFGPLSYDCLPAPADAIAGAPLTLPFALTSVEAGTLGTDLVDGANEVYCLQCSGDSSIGCSSNADCAALGLGTCSVNTGPAARANACADGFCTVSGPYGNGECLANPADRFCDGITRGDGTGLLTCDDNADCAALDADCPGGSCGTCSLLQRRSCFPDPIGALGSDAQPGAVPSAGVYGADLVSTLCVPATGEASVDSALGLPGPARLRINFDFVGRCAGDPFRPYELPGGSNCP